MNYQVIYYSRSGQTKKIADAIASELGVITEDVKHARLNNDSIVILGSGCYGGKPAKSIIKFIQDNEFKDRTVFLFGTSGGGLGQEIEKMKAHLKPKGATIKGTFYCKGKFLIASRGHPTQEDLEKAKTFAKTMI